MNRPLPLALRALAEHFLGQPLQPYQVELLERLVAPPPTEHDEMTSKQQLAAQANIAALRAEKEAEQEAAAIATKHAEYWFGIEQEKQRIAKERAEAERAVQESLNRQAEALISVSDGPQELPYLSPLQTALDEQDDHIDRAFRAIVALEERLEPLLAGQEGTATAFGDETPTCPLVHRLRGHNGRLDALRATIENLTKRLEC